MVVYTLFLSNSIATTTNGYKDDSMVISGFKMTPVSSGVYPEMYYNINFDNLFKGANYDPKFTKCRVRCNIKSGALNAENGYNNHLGRMNLNLVSDNYLVGTSNGIPINLYNYAKSNVSAGFHININNSLYSETGVEIVIPRGYSTLLVSFPHYARMQTLFVTAFSQYSPYGLLSFELI